MTNICDYKLKFLKNPKSSEDMVKGLNTLIKIINELGPFEIIPTQEFPHTHQQCIELLILVATQLPNNYSLHVNIARIEPIFKKKSPPPVEEKILLPQKLLPEAQAPKPKVKKLNKKPSEKKDNLNPPTPITQELEIQPQPIKYKLIFQKLKKKTKSILITKSNRKQKRKNKSAKQVHWEDEKQKISIEENIIEENKESDKAKATELSLEYKSEKKEIGQRNFFWSENKQQINSSSTARASITKTVNVHETARRIYRPTGEIEEIFERKSSLSEQLEVISLEPFIKRTEFALHSVRTVACLESMQAANMELIRLILILTEQPNNPETLKIYSNHVSSYYHYIKSMTEDVPVSLETSYTCPLNPRTVCGIMQSNLKIHESLAKLFSDSSIIGLCLGQIYEVHRLMQQILPSGYWIEYEEGVVARRQNSSPYTLWNTPVSIMGNPNDEQIQNSYNY